MVTGSSHKQLLVRQGDWFLGQPEKIFDDDLQSVLHHFRNLTVLENYPVKQGYIHSNTEVIIVLNRQASMFHQIQLFKTGDITVFKLHTENAWLLLYQFRKNHIVKMTRLFQGILLWR